MDHKTILQLVLGFLTLLPNFQVGYLLDIVSQHNEDVIFFNKNQFEELHLQGNRDVAVKPLIGADFQRHLNDVTGKLGGEAERAIVGAAAVADNKNKREHFIDKHKHGNRKIRAAAAEDANCAITGDQINRIFNNKFHFNDTNFNLALLWTGPDSKELLALTTMELGIFASPSHLWISLDYGKTFANIDDRIEGAIIKKSDGIFKSPLDPKRVVLISFMSDMDVFGSKFYTSQDGGRNFKVVTAPFYPEGKIKFHPAHKDLMFIMSVEKEVWLSHDFGSTWNQLKDRVQQAAWATTEMDAGNDLFILQDVEGEGLQLIKTSNLGRSYNTVQKRVQNFGLQGKFIYAAIDSEDESSDGDDVQEHVLHVSTDRGHSWNPTQLPVITSDRFFSVLDMSEGLIFMHVDDPGDTGTGTIYTSAADGIVFSASLDRHLFPNGVKVTDFYRVDSMRGVYIASQIQEDQTIRTMITYDRGGIWETVSKPAGIECHDVGECSLQIHNHYSQAKQINVPSGPLSDSKATGIILVHATVATSLELRDPDVFVSSDGGYTWSLALSGPHHYTITNSGGLLIAVPTSSGATDTVKFSYDEGHCWNSYKFSDELITVTGLLPEPSRKSLNVSIWGFGSQDNQWRSFTIDFGAILETECSESDFVEWKPHEDNDQNGCLMGLRESFHRVKPDSMCRVSFNFEQEPISSEECDCTKADYECDFGFYRPDNSEDCVLSPQYQNKDLEYCEYGHEEEIKTWGYRKIPGDVCMNGYQPQRDVEKLKAKCDGSTSSSSKSHSVALGIVIMLLVLLVLGGIFLLYKKKKLICLQNGVRKTYQYTQLNQGDSVDSQALDLMDNGVGYHDDSDEDMLD